MSDQEQLVQTLTEEVETLREILDHAYECIVVIDGEGFVNRINRTYEKVLTIAPGVVVGKHVTEVIENTRMHLVARTGVAEVGWTQKIKGVERIVQRIPIVRNELRRLPCPLLTGRMSSRPGRSS
jgi:transcriptional regulator with PAS, ATPase and Fis domain